MLQLIVRVRVKSVRIYQFHPRHSPRERDPFPWHVLTWALSWHTSKAYRDASSGIPEAVARLQCRTCSPSWPKATRTPTNGRRYVHVFHSSRRWFMGSIELYLIYIEPLSAPRHPHPLVLRRRKYLIARGKSFVTCKASTTFFNARWCAPLPFGGNTRLIFVVRWLIGWNRRREG